MNKVKLYSLKNQSSFNEISKVAVKYVCRYFILCIADTPENYINLSRKIENDKNIIFYGFKVSRKYGKSVDRNLLKRRMKNIYHSVFQENYKPLGIIFIPRSQIKSLNFDEIKDQTKKAIIWYYQKNKL